MEASAVVMSEDKAGVTEKVEINNTDAGLEPESHQNERQLETHENGLMWSIAGVRKLFKEHRMWPTFVGPKYLQHGVPRINLPVLQWKEQASYLEKNGPSDGTGERSNTKRKEAPAAEVENEGLSENKRTRTSTADATEEERTRSLIFEDLHKRNYFVGPADAYGGDYSLYKGGGDPTQTHSIATVRVIEKGHKISARELLAFSRVQNQVAKSAVLAFKLPVEATQAGEEEEESESGRKGGTQAKSEKVGYIMINFRNVSDRV